MISKKKAIIGAVLIVIITSVLNYTVGNILGVKLGQRFIISKDTYEYYQDIQQTHKKLLQLSEFLEENYYKEINPEVLAEGAVKGMFAGVGDPYTVYMNEKEFNDLMTRTSGSYGGIGVIVTPGEDGYVTVVSPIEDTPGEKAGITTGDKIIAVDGTAIYGEKLEEAVGLMKGKPGTEVILTIRRKGVTNALEVPIEREEIRLQTVKSEVLEENIGYIRISMFDEQTAADFKNHLKKLEKQKIEGLILDLRNNPGGLLSQCIEISDMLLGEQTIVYTEDRQGNKEVEKSDKSKIDYPLAVLVNGGSASASEILSGAIKDGEAGTIIGTTTFGKGLVQQVKPLADGTGFKFTVAQYFTPNGTNIHGTGVEPNIVVELPEELKDKTTIEKDDDIQLHKAIEVVQDKIKK
ncbi:S41 family peptidase [Alkaliphilus hydrothermalis]|uniref:Carboxyl-terminal processing protease n=1 Tax=Alkaliphilus hydrothermalis TaxID=1482730 RepID=A0ABS2NNU1_9FIRM|nr:S41 family peptidase [Alkaliphilus hydrothermalis]MBM7614244.1 carboxyl-terminal processing protease [Alkaliphilus hydrothermalis]